MGEEVEKHVLRKYELLQKLGKGVRASLITLLSGISVLLTLEGYGACLV